MPSSARGLAVLGPVTEIYALPDTSAVWDLTTDSHDFFADDVLVHNCDEISTWDQTPDSSGLTAWDNARIATRLGVNPQLVAMTTPKRIPSLRKLVEEIENNPRLLLRRGRTSDNAGNLAQSYLDAIYGLYANTALATQELEGQMLGAVEGALWSEDDIYKNRIAALPPAAALFQPVVVIGVDPSVSDRPRDECGIIVLLGTTEPALHQRRLYVLHDGSGQLAPAEWAARTASLARLYGGVVVAEVNQGGALVRTAIQNVDPAVRVIDVHSRFGKAIRAEPIQLASQQGRLKFVGEFPLLTDQLTSWEPGVSRHSPDRLDALVHAGTAFLTPDPKHALTSGGSLTITNNAQRRRIALGARRVDLDIPAWQQASVRGLFGRR